MQLGEFYYRIISISQSGGRFFFFCVYPFRGRTPKLDVCEDVTLLGIRERVIEASWRIRLRLIGVLLAV